MNCKSQLKKIKYPENLAIKASLERRDPILIASMTGFNPQHVRFVLNGYRKMNNKIEKAIVKILTRRHDDKVRLNSIVKKG